MDRKMVLLGGGEIRTKETLEIDRRIVAMARERAGDRRVNALFIGTASHDFMPYYNSFHKEYTGDLGVKTDVALTVYRASTPESLDAKFEKADLIYVGGGDTVFMIEEWKRTGLIERIRSAYERGVILCGLSAGAICWFDTMYTDSADTDEKYAVREALGWLKGGATPHYDLRREDFARNATQGTWLCLENNAAAVFVNERLTGTISAGGKVCLAEVTDAVKETPIGEICDET